MSSTRIESLLEDVQRAFDEAPARVEDGLEVDDAALLQLRKACRLLAGADRLLDTGYYTLVVEASFVAIERTVEFRLLDRGEMTPQKLPGSHTSLYEEAASVGLFSERIAADLADLWGEHRAKTYYQDGLAAEKRARRLHALAAEVHQFVLGRSSRGHECICDVASTGG